VRGRDNGSKEEALAGESIADAFFFGFGFGVREGTGVETFEVEVPIGLDVVAEG
jgi:hypothetical protein